MPVSVLEDRSHQSTILELFSKFALAIFLQTQEQMRNLQNYRNRMLWNNPELNHTSITLFLYQHKVLYIIKPQEDLCTPRVR